MTIDPSHQLRLTAGEAAYLRHENTMLRASALWPLVRCLRVSSLCLAGGPRAIARRLYWLARGQLGTRLREEFDIETIAASGFFDEEYYRGANHDVAGYQGGAIAHFVRHGAAEGRRPNAWFDTAAYWRGNPDVAASGRNPLAHFIRHGLTERRLPGPQLPQSPPSKDDLATTIAVSDNRANAERWYDATSPAVSIIILNWNKSALTVRCLRRLWQHTSGHRFEIIVVDNGSNPDQVAMLRELDGPFRLLPLPANRFFGEGNNIGVEAAGGQFLLFLNNDAFVTAGWLEPLMEVFTRHADAGMTGPKFVYPDGRLQEAGADIDARGVPTQFGKGGDPADPRFNVERAVGYCSAACVLMPRHVFEQALGFDLAWEPAYYEDTDLCFKIKLLGLKVYYCPRATVVHLESATSTDCGRALKLDNIMEINRGRFVGRWGRYLAGGGAPRGLVRAAFPPAPAGASGRRRIALYTPYDMLPGGGEMYLFTVAAALAASWEVTVVSHLPYSRMRLLTMGRELNLDLDAVRMACLDRIRGEAPFDLAVTLGNDILPPEQGLGRRNIHMCQFPFPIGAADALRRREHWGACDAVVVNSPFTREHAMAAMRRLGLPSRPIKVITPPVQLIDGPCRKEAGLILSVGRFYAGGHNKRHDVMIEAFRRLHAEIGGGVELHLAGALHPQPQHRDHLLHLREMAAGLPVVFHLNIERNELVGLYRRAAVYWHAAGIGVDVAAEPEKCEHFGISVVEAMSAGCIAVVPDRGGPAALVRPGETGFHYAETAQLAETTARILADLGRGGLAAMPERAIAASAQYADPRFRRRWIELVEELVQASVPSTSKSAAEMSP